MRSRLVAVFALSLSSILVLRPATLPARGASDAAELSIRITSPLGRTGLVERVRIVAQVTHRDERQLAPVKFFVDDALLGVDDDGPPYAVEWSDTNPFESREISVEVSDAKGAVARDRVTLNPIVLTETADVMSIVLDVSVHDHEGRFVRGLGAGDFRLFEDGAPQALDVVSTQRLGATFTLLVDTSQSMARRIEAVRHAAANFTHYLRPDDRIVIAPFSRSLGTVTGPTNDKRTIEEAIDEIQSRGGTAILDAVRDVSEQLKGVEGRQALVLLTDGYDEHSTLGPEAALVAVRSLQAPLYVVGIAGSAGMSMKGERFLRDLAAATGGRAFFPFREVQYDAINQRVAEDMQQRYLLAYTPANQRTDGTWRALEVAASNAEWVVRAKPGYFAPAPPPVRPSLEFTMMNSRRELMAVSVEDLMVREDGVPQALETFEEAVSPVSMVLALDASGSMKKAAEAAQAAARLFVTSIRRDDKLAMATFADGVVWHHDFATHRPWSHSAIDEYVATGGTALYDALYESFLRLRREKGRRVAVVVTDGRDEDNPGTAPGSVHTFDQVLELLKEADATVFTIGLGPNVDRDILTHLSTESGGESYFPEDVTELEAQYRRILENLRRRYVISYTSTNATRDGNWRQVEIVSRIPDTAVISKGGYFAPQE